MLDASDSTSPGAGTSNGRDLELAVDPDVGDGTRLEMQVGAPDLVQVRQELFQLGHTAYIGLQRWFL